MATVKEISDFINSFAPYETMCKWDNCGILIGDSEKTVRKLGFVLDLTAEALESAVESGVDMIITHHPVIFKAQKSFVKGDVVFDAAVNGISVLSAHTCFDCAEGGVNDVLCEILEIENVRGVPSEECEVPMARIGEIKEMSSRSFAEMVSGKLETVCRVVDCNKTIRKVAVCGGSGADFMDDVIKMGADAYVTGDMNHHDFLYAKEKGLTVIAAGHFETENPSMKAMMNIISSEFKDIEACILRQSNPVEYVY